MIIKKIMNYVKYQWIDRMRTMTMHVEMIYEDDIWELIKDSYNKNPDMIFFVMTPVNYDLLKVEHGLKLGIIEYEKIIIERYIELRDAGANIQLHVHIRSLPVMYTNKEEIKKEASENIKAAMIWIKSNCNIHPTMITMGHFFDTEEVDDICQEMKLDMIRIYDHPSTHDYELRHHQM